MNYEATSYDFARRSICSEKPPAEKWNMQIASQLSRVHTNRGAGHISDANSEGH